MSFNCIGVDNYNFMTDERIGSLKDIATLYMRLIMDKYLVDGRNEPIRLLGWSLGGLIAMEMAYQLEQEGYKQIYLYFLDTVIQTPELKRLYDKIDDKRRNDKLKTYLGDKLNTYLSTRSTEHDNIKKYFII